MKVLLVDDHPVMLDYLKGAIGGALKGAKVRTAGGIESALQAARAEAPDFVVLDLGLPGCAGIDALIRFRSAFPKLRVVVFSAAEERAVVRGALKAGAAGFVPKSAPPKVVVGALRFIAEGGSFFPPKSIAEERDAGLPEAGLTERQREVLGRLLAGSSVAQAARELGISPATAKHHAHAVYAAFGVSSRADLILVAGRGGDPRL